MPLEDLFLLLLRFIAELIHIYRTISHSDSGRALSIVAFWKLIFMDPCRFHNHMIANTLSLNAFTHPDF